MQGVKNHGMTPTEQNIKLVRGEEKPKIRIEIEMELIKKKLALRQQHHQSNLDLRELLDAVRHRLATSPQAFQPQNLANIRRERGRKEESQSMKAWG